MRYIVLMVVMALLAACERDPYMARKGGYTPGKPYHHQSGIYPGVLLTRADS